MAAWLPRVKRASQVRIGDRVQPPVGYNTEGDWVWKIQKTEDNKYVFEIMGYDGPYRSYPMDADGLIEIYEKFGT